MPIFFVSRLKKHLLSVRILVVQERLKRTLGFVLYCTAVSLDTKPPVRAASARLCCDIIINSVFSLQRTSTQR